MQDNSSTNQTVDSYVVTHCRQCAAGWTRTKGDGGVVTVCLLDRELALAGMTHCDRYEPRGSRQA